jgi:hypothetical protein
VIRRISKATYPIAVEPWGPREINRY